MYNDFILVGPKNDPAGMKGMKDIVTALKTLKDKSAAFISRGDKSGTHIAEINLWKLAGDTGIAAINPATMRARCNGGNQ